MATSGKKPAPTPTPSGDSFAQFKNVGPAKKTTGGSSFDQFLPGAKKPAKKPVKNPQAATTKAVNSTVSAIANAVMKPLQTGLSFTEGAALGAIKKIQSGDPLGAIGAGLAKGIENTGNLWADKPVVSGAEIIKQLGLYQQTKKVSGPNKQNTIQLQGMGAGGFTPQGTINLSDQQLANMATHASNVAMALGVDIAADPFTYADGIGVIANGAKAASVGTKIGLKAASMARKGAVPLKVAARKIGKEEAAKLTEKSLATSATGGYTKKAAITPEMVTGAEVSKKGAKTLSDLQEKLTGKLNYKVVQLPSGETAKRYEVLASSLEAFDKAARSVIAARKGAKFIEKYAKKAATGVEHGAENYVYTGEKLAQEGTTPVIPTPAEVSIKNPIIYSGQKVVSDTAPVAHNVAAMATPKDITAIETVLNKVNKIAKTTEGVTAAGESNVKNIRALLSNVHGEQGVFLRKLPAEVVNKMKFAIQGDGTDPFKLIDELASSTQKNRNDLAKMIMDSKIPTPTGSKVSVGSLFHEHGGSYSALRKADPTSAAKVADLLKNFTQRTNPVAVSDFIEKFTTEKLGSEAAAKLKEAGAFNTKKIPSATAIEEILSKIPSSAGGEVTKYSNIHDLIAGLRSGHEVPLKKLEQIVRAIDPQNSTLKLAAKAAPQEYTNMIRSIVMGSENTMASMQMRWNMMNADTFLNATGLHGASGVAAYVDQRITGKIPADTTALARTRQAAAETTQINMEHNAKNFADALNSLARGLDQNYDYMREIMASPDALEHVSSLNEIAIRNTEKAYATDTKAANRLQWNQSLEAKVLGSIFGKKTWRAENAKIVETDAEIASKKLDYAIGQIQMVDEAGYAMFGVRFTQHKWVKQAAGKLENKHFVYLNFGDIAKTLRDMKTFDGKQAIIDGFFPYGEGIIANKDGVVDSLSTIGLGSVARQLIEARQTGEALKATDLVKTLTAKAETQKVWGSAFKKTAKARAEKIVEALNKPEVLDKLEQIHKEKAVADIESNMEVAHTMNRLVMERLSEALRSKVAAGIDTELARLQSLKDGFVQLSYTSGILNQLRGDVAEAMLKSLSMLYLNGGKLADLIGPEEMAQIRGLMNTMFRHENPEAAAPLGREGLPFPTKGAKAAAESRLNAAMLAYEGHIGTIAAQTTKAEVKTWLTTWRRMQKELDAARKEAWLNWIDTKHYDVATKTWIDSSQFDHAASVAAAQQMDRIILQDGVAHVGAEVADTAPVRPRKPSKQQIWETASAEEPIRQKRNRKLADGAGQDAAAYTLQSAPEILNAAEGDIAVAQARTIQEFYDKPLRDSKIRVHTSYGKRSGVLGKGEIANPRIQQLGEQFSARAGKQATAPILAMAEAAKQTANSNMSHALDLLRKAYSSLGQEGFKTAFEHFGAGTLPANADSLEYELVVNLNNVMDPVKQAMAEAGFSSDSLNRVLSHYGLTEKNGFAKFDKKTQNGIANYFKDLPFAAKPSWASDLTDSATQEWISRAEAFNESGTDPFIALSRFAMAVQHVKTEKTIAEQLVSNFSHTSLGWDAAKAKANGWVQVKGIPGNGVDLTSHFGTGENAPFFHPDIAPQIGALNREWNAFGKAHNQFVKMTMGVMSLLKAQQTVWTPRHHIVNIVGDNGIAIVYGTRPEHFVPGSRIANILARKTLGTEYGGAKLINQLDELAKSADDGSKFFQDTANLGKNYVSFKINGKNMQISLEDLAREFDQRGITISNIFNDEIAALSESVLSAGNEATGAKKTLFQSINHALYKANRTAKIPGDLTVFYGNVPRAAHAIAVGAKRAWRSEEEMFAAMAKEIHLTHPTIQSLASKERTISRPLFSYYTWLRVAHSAFLDMALNHARWMNIYPNLQYEIAKENQMNPTSAAVPWSPEMRQNLPDYLTKSAYGPTFGGTEPTLVRPPILPLDVMETWNFTWDPTKSWLDNLNSVGQQETINFVKQTNMLGKQILGGALNFNFDTQKPAGTDTAAGQAEYWGNLFPIFSQFAVGAGLYTPIKNAETGGNPLQPADRTQKIINYFTGAKMQRINTPANLKIGQQQLTERIKRINTQGK